MIHKYKKLATSSKKRKPCHAVKHLSTTAPNAFLQGGFGLSAGLNWLAYQVCLNSGALRTEHASSRTRHHPEKVNTIRYEAPKSARAIHRAHESRAHAQYIRNRRFEAYSKATCAQADVTSPRHIQIPSHGSSNRNDEQADRPQRWNHGRKGQQNQT